MKDRDQTLHAAKMSGNIYGKKSGKSPRYGSPSVMEKYREDEMPSEEREFRELGGIEMLANKARGISNESTDDPLTFKGNQAAALEYKKTFDDSTIKRINQDVSKEITRAKNPGFHTGTPSEAKKRLPSVKYQKSRIFKKKLMNTSSYLTKKPKY